MSQSISQSRFIATSLFLITASLTVLSSGCSSLTSFNSKPLPVDNETVDSANGMYSVEMHSNYGAPKQYKGALTGTTTVSEALKKAGAIKKWKSIDVEILRIVNNKGKNRGLRMPISFDPSIGGPSPEQDYALLDGDRVVVRPKESGSLVKMVGAMMGQ